MTTTYPENPSGASSQTKVVKPLNQILDEIEVRYGQTLDAPDDDTYEASLTDVPRLVKALRVAWDGLLDNYGPTKEDRQAAIRDFTAILDGTEEGM